MSARPLPHRDVPRRAAEAGTAEFAHPVEREIARIFDEHGLEWLYEPRTFVLERGPDGSVREAFTPDFYLPQLDLYVECTVLRDALMHRKRRKVRKARRQGITVEILGRRDIERLAGRWRLGGLARAADAGPAPGLGMGAAAGANALAEGDV